MRIRYNGKMYEVWLRDEGTLDTVITVNGKRHAFDGEYASSCRRRNGAMTKAGLRRLAIEAIDSDWE